MHDEAVAQRINAMTLQEKLGQMFVTGFSKEKINDSFRLPLREKSWTT